MKNIITVTLLLFTCIATAQQGIFNQNLSRIDGHFLRDHLDVSTAGAINNYALAYDASTRGWKPKNLLSLFSSIPNNYVLYMSAGAVFGSANMTYDGTVFQVAQSVNPRIRSYRSSTGAAYMEVANTSNTWQWYINGSNAGMEPDIANGNFDFRNLANTVLFRFNFASGIFENLAGTTIRVTGKAGTATGLTGFDSSSGLTTVALGAGLSITSGTLAATTLGTVTSVGLSLPAIFSVSGSPVTTTGTLTASLATQVANTVFAGPSAGVDAAPTFRTLVADDVPDLAASTITHTDAGGYYSTDNSEAIAQEIGAELLLHEGENNIGPADASTITLDTYTTFVYIVGESGSTQTHTFDIASMPQRARVIVKTDEDITSVTFTTATGNIILSNVETASSLVMGPGEVTELMLISTTLFQLY